jgi:hypothetical protein
VPSLGKASEVNLSTKNSISEWAQPRFGHPVFPVVLLTSYGIDSVENLGAEFKHRLRLCRIEQTPKIQKGIKIESEINNRRETYDNQISRDLCRRQFADVAVDAADGEG